MYCTHGRKKDGLLPFLLLLIGAALAACVGPPTDGSSHDADAGSESSSTTSSGSTTESSSVVTGRISGSTTAASSVQRGTFEARAGQTVVVEYDVEVREGDLLLTLQDPSGRSVWEATLDRDGREVVQHVASDEGRYLVPVQGEDSTGAFTVSWKVE
jgi:hypothetical protein